MPGATVYIGDLPYDTRERDIEDFFAKSRYGRVESIRLRSRFGFADFSSRRDADDVIRDLDGERLLGSRVRLEISEQSRGGGSRRGRSRSRSRGRGGRSDRGRPHRTNYTIEIDNLSSSVSWADLKDLFRKVGEVTYTDANQRLGRNRGEICFADRESMIAAKKRFDGEDINGRRIKITIVEDGGRSRSRSRSRSSRRRRSSRSRSDSRGGRSRSRSDSRDKSRRSRSRSTKRSRSKSRSESRSRSRSNRRSRRSRS